MKIALLLSGGVDSSTALRRLQSAGYSDITAFYLKIWLEDELSYLGECPWEEDLSYAQGVCERAGVPLEIINLQLEYFDRVVAYAVDELKAGRTPSPDIFCNQRVKFGAFFDRVGDQFDLIATGHYALTVHPTLHDPWTQPSRIQKHSAWSEPNLGQLFRAPDPVKDQSYFLSHLSGQQVSRLIFPIGDVPKAQVRQLAQDYDLPNKDRRDSQGICFLGKIPFNEFVRHYLGQLDGPLVDAATGQELGRHQGYWFHTIGQRSGLGLGNGPWYVAAKDPEHNVVYVSHADTNPLKDRYILEVNHLNWIGGRWPQTADLERWNSFEPWAPAVNQNIPAIGERARRQQARDYRGFQLKLRHGPVLVPCQAQWVPGFGPSDPIPESDRRLQLQMETADPGIAAGQFAVLYVDDECLGGGRILELDYQTLLQFRQRYQETSSVQAQALADERQRKAAKAKAKRQKYSRPGSTQ